MSEILEMVINQVYRGQLMVNRFHYVMTGTPAVVTPTFGLLEATGFGQISGTPSVFPDDTLARQMQGFLHNEAQFVSAYARNLYSVTDFYERPYPVATYGTNNGEPMSPLAAVGFFSSRVRTDIRRGFKRFGACSESQWESGGVLTAGWRTIAAAMCDYLGDTLTYDDEGNTLTFTPAVLGLEKYTAPSGKPAYRPYATKSAQEAHLAQGIDWSFYTTMRSQVSRQIGRGA